MRAVNWMCLGVALALFVSSVIGGIADDVRRGRAGYDSVYYRSYIPYTSPMGLDESITQVRNLPVGGKAWVRSGAGCEYLIEHAYDGDWRYHLGKVHEARSRWGLPCHEANWWRTGSIIAEGGLDDCAGGYWQGRRESHGGGFKLRWKCVGGK